MDVIMNEVLFLRLLACSAIVALNLFAMELSDTVSLETIAAVYDMVTILAMTFLHCYYAETVTKALLGVGDAFFESSWYTGAIGQNAIVLLMPIQRSQRQFRMVTFNMIECSLTVFLKVGQMPNDLELNKTG